MLTRRFAQVFGVIYVLVGLMGFIPGLHPMGAGTAEHQMVVTSLYGALLSLFPINILHNLVHLLIGGLGLAAGRTYPAARNYAMGLFIFYGILAIGGFIPGLNTMFGLIPIFGNDTWLHGLSSLVALYFAIRPNDVTAIDAGRAVRGRA